MSARRTTSRTERHRSDILSESFVPALLVWLVTTVVLALSFGYLPPEIPLFYSLPVGESRLAAKEFAFLMPALNLIFLIVHGVLHRLDQSDHMYRRLLVVTGLMMTVLYSYAVIKMLMIIL